MAGKICACLESYLLKQYDYIIGCTHALQLTSYKGKKKSI